MLLPSAAVRWFVIDLSRMKNLIVGLCLATLALSRAHGLNLSPNELLTSSDAPAIKRYFFDDEGKRLTFRIDDKMGVTGSSDAVAFRFSDIPGADMKILRSSLAPGVPFDEKHLNNYRDLARRSLPPQASNIEIEAETSNAIAINRWTSHQFIFAYDLFGLRYRRSITFLNYSEKEQFIIDVQAGSAEYDKAYARGYRVLNSISDTPIDPTGPT